MSDSYGEAFGRRLGARSTSFVTRALPRSLIAITELKYETPQYTLSTPPTTEDAFIVAVHLKHFHEYAYWEDGRAASVAPIGAGETIIYDVKRRPTFLLNSPFHSVHFYFPRAALNAIAEDASAPGIAELHYRPAVSHRDPVLKGIAEALLPAFAHPEEASRLFMDNLMLAAGHHVARRYGGMLGGKQSSSGGLSRWQLQRAKELLRASLSRDIALDVIAAECGLSLSQFSRSFKKSVGVPPYRWVIKQRVELAKALMRQGSLSLADVAAACGFADQSHFTRHFAGLVGTSPGAWRRMWRT